MSAMTADGLISCFFSVSHDIFFRENSVFSFQTGAVTLSRSIVFFSFVLSYQLLTLAVIMAAGAKIVTGVMTKRFLRLIKSADFGDPLNHPPPAGFCFFFFNDISRPIFHG